MTDDETGAETGAEPDTVEPSVQPPSVPLPPRKVWLVAAVAPVLLVIDQITKQLALAGLEHEPPVRVLGGLFYLQIVRNPGAAWGMATGMTWVLTLIALAVVIGILAMVPKLRSTGWAIGLGLVLSGALGNLLDRFFRAPGAMHGHVVDFLSPFAPNGEAFPVFNVADSAICVGGALILLMALLGHDYDGRRTSEKKKDAK